MMHDPHDPLDGILRELLILGLAALAGAVADVLLGLGA